MSQVAVVTDSLVCLPKGATEKYNIGVVPLSVIFGNKVYRDGIDFKPKDFYPLLEQAEKLPTSSARSPQAFLDAYLKAGLGAQAIACILLTKSFSPMGWEAAHMAKEMAKEVMPGVTIEVIDTRTAVGAVGFVVLTAAEGQSLAEVIKAARGRALPLRCRPSHSVSGWAYRSRRADVACFTQVFWWQGCRDEWGYNNSLYINLLSPLGNPDSAYTSSLRRCQA
jgi:hypothetical protein